VSFWAGLESPWQTPLAKAREANCQRSLDAIAENLSFNIIYAKLFSRTANLEVNMNPLPEIFQTLKTILEPYAKDMVLHKDQPDEFYLNLHHKRQDGYQYYFGSVKIGKNHVSYHLMAVYAYPDLLEEVSDALKKRMQGKSCFNFKKPDPVLFAELGNLTARGFERFMKEGLA
jgi:hypothetical protein